VTWVESASPSFRARHDIGDLDDADRVLYGLERMRARLERNFPRLPGDITVVLHGSPVGLAFANPLFPLAWVLTEPASRRYVAGWAGATELHVLGPAALETRACAIEGSREMLALAPAALYARRAIAASHPALRAAKPHRRVVLELRWAWLIEGGSRWFAGQTEHAAPAIARRLRQRTRLEFPPTVRDAALLGQTVVDLLAKARGAHTAAGFVCRFRPEHPSASLLSAFGVRSFGRLERAWRSHVYALAASA
jgi:hypothetical protein